MIRVHNPGAQVQSCLGEVGYAVREVLESAHYILGAKVKQFEETFAAFIGVAHAVGVGNGTDALELALRALGCGAGDEVAMVANAGGFGTTACLQVGAVPVYADIDPVTMQMDYASLMTVLSPRTKAVILTHLYGWMNDVRALRALLDDAGYAQVKIIEDCAQAHGASLAGERAGALGDIATFSFYPTKNLGALGDGGMIVTANAELAASCRHLRHYGWEYKYHATQPYGRNSRLDEMQAALLLVFFPRLNEWNERRRRHALELQQAAAAMGAMLCAEDSARYVAHLCVLRHEKRDQLAAHLKSEGVETDIHYPVLDCDQPFMKRMTFRSAALPCSRQANRQLLTLPCHPLLTGEQVAHVGLSLRQFGRQAA